MSSTEFQECDTCRAKPGLPVLCNGCLHNRAVIEAMRRVLQKIRADAKDILDKRSAQTRRISLMTEWQPIETAPKDGQYVLLYGPNLSRRPHGQVVAAYFEYQIEYWHVEDGKFGPYPLRGPAPTHWMPLPEPPND